MTKIHHAGPETPWRRFSFAVLAVSTPDAPREQGGRVHAITKWHLARMSEVPLYKFAADYFTPNLKVIVDPSFSVMM